LFIVSKFANQDYTDLTIPDPNQDYYLLFGKETTGLPEPFMRKNPEKAIRIPQDDDNIRGVESVKYLCNCDL
jgi:tRNA (cytidine/uridine-2'-O-)-methyltransferase